MLQIMRFVPFPVTITFLPALALAHGGHTQQPVGIIDPLITHHAILEDELKLNYFARRFRRESSSAHTGSLEVAYAFTDLLGFELFVPFGVTSMSSMVRGGLGDLELLVPKMSFLRRRGWVMTTYVAARLPTGNEEAGLGRPGWGFAPHLLMDVGLGNVGIQANFAVELQTDGSVALEGNLSLAYSFVLSRAREMFLSPLVEANLEAPVRGDDAGRAFLALTPGVKFSFGGWHLGAGVQLPVSSDREFDFRALFQVGYHVKWEALFGKSTASHQVR